jgi:hypothetical protein
MLKLVLTILVLTAALQAQASRGKPLVLADRSYNLKMFPGSFVCREPVAPNGHNYPVNTALLYNQIPYDLWLSNVWTNVSDYQANLQYPPCSTFNKILQAPQGTEFVGAVHQVTTESYDLNGFKDCMRTTREEATLTVEGIMFQAVTQFLVGPLPAQLCK